MALLEEYSVQPGDKVAILSGGMPNWGCLSCNYIHGSGCSSCPSGLHCRGDIKCSDTLRHQSAVCFRRLTSKIADFASETLETVVSTEDFSVLSGFNGTVYDPETEAVQSEYHCQ